MFLAFQTSPLLPQATVVTRRRRASPSVSWPSAMRRALHRSQQGSSWWLPPPPGRGRGMGWERNPFSAQRELGVYRWTTPPAGEIPAPSGAAAITPCQRACSRLVVAGVRSLVLVRWLVGGSLACQPVCLSTRWLGSLFAHRLAGSSACWLARRLSGLLLGSFVHSTALRLVGGVLVCRQLVCSLGSSLACRRHCSLLACCLLGGSLARQRRFGSFGGSLACSAAP